MDISKYIENKDSYDFLKVGTIVVASKRKWDPETGAEVEPEMQQINLTELETQKTNLQKSIDGLGAFISAIKAILNPVE